MDRRTGPNQNALQLLRSWGHNNALMYEVCPDKINFLEGAGGGVGWGGGRDR